MSKAQDLISSLVAEFVSRGLTDYAIRKDTGLTEPAMRRIRAGGGTTIETFVKLAEYLGYEVRIIKKINKKPVSLLQEPI